ncbi:hypothetical protein V6N13_120492 [Hibiscus sabdariffa]
MPKLRLTYMMALGKEEIKVELTKNVCSRARKWAVNQIRGSVKEFNRLYDYVFALREADPTGTFDLVVEGPTPNDTPIFRWLYVCFIGLKEGFIRYCRPVLCLDGCYLKGPLKGELLAAVGRDGNNQIFPIAWVVVEVENKETWGWFLKNVQIDLQLGNGDKVIVISDMQKLTPIDSTMEPPPSQASSHTMPNIDSPMEPSSQASSHTMPNIDSPMETPPSHASSHTMSTVPNA